MEQPYRTKDVRKKRALIPTRTEDAQACLYLCTVFTLPPERPSRQSGLHDADGRETRVVKRDEEPPIFRTAPVDKGELGVRDARRRCSRHEAEGVVAGVGCDAGAQAQHTGTVAAVAEESGAMLTWRSRRKPVK